jgi:hypothetical protein
VQHTFLIYVQLQTTVLHIVDHAYPSLHVCQIIPYQSLQPQYHLFHLPISYSHPIYYHYYRVQSVMFDQMRKVKDFSHYFLFLHFVEHPFFPHMLVSDFFFKEFPLKYLAKKFL